MSSQFTLKTLGKMALAICWVFVVPASPLQAQSPPVEGTPYSLKECIAYALRNHKNIENARFDAYIADAQAKEVRGAGLPQVSAGASFTQYGDIPISVFDIRNFATDPTAAPIPEGLPDEFYYQTAQFGLKYGAQVNGQISQLLFDGSFLVGLKAAKEYAKLTEVNVQRTEEETAYNVAKAYYSALVNEERATLLSINLERLEELVRTTEALYREGFAEKVDVDRLQIQLSNLETEFNKVQALVELGFAVLKFQMNMPLENEIRLTDKIENLRTKPSLEELNPDADYADGLLEMDLLHRQLKLQELKIKRDRSSPLGSLVAFGNLQYNTYRPRFFDLEIDPNWFPTSLIGLQYNVTLFDGFQNRFRVQQSKLEIQKVQNNMDLLRLGTQLQTRSAVTNLTNAYADVENAERNLKLAESIRDISSAKLEQGVGSNLEVIDAQSTLYETQVNYLTAVYDFTLAQLELQKVKGEFRKQYVPLSN